MRRLAIVLAAALAAATCACGSEQAPAGAWSAPPAARTAIPPPAPPLELAPPRERVVAIGRGPTHACVVRASGGVDCWGRFGEGRPEPAVRRIPGVRDATAISPDGRCVLRATGEVACLAVDRVEFVPVAGLAEVGVLGTGDTACFVHRDRRVSCDDGSGPQRIPGVDDAIAVTSSGRVACAVRAGGDVVCAAAGRDGFSPFTPVTGLGPVRRLVFAGGVSASGCAVLAAGGVRCVSVARGEDDAGWVVADATRYGERLTGLDAEQLAGATEIAVGDRGIGVASPPFVLDALVGGRVVRWSETGTAALPGLTDAVALAPGCAIRATGAVACWGTNAGGALGQPTTIGRALRPPTPVVGLADVTAIALGAREGWALDGAGRVYHWGRNAAGWALEVPLPGDAARPSAITATAGGSACVLVDGGAVWCWSPRAPAFARVHAADVIGIAGETGAVLALRADGTVVRTALDPERDGNLPVAVQPQAGPPGVVAITSGRYRACLRTRDGAAYCGELWGHVPGVLGATEAVTDFVGCALQRGAITCWRYDYDSRLPVPEAAPAVTDATDLARSSDRLCAVRAGGRVTCWMGSGREREVIAEGAVAVELGKGDSDEHGPYGCAIMTDRRVQCWGTNFDGELGDGSIHASAAPLGVPGL